jgi:hypothetical protein
MIQVDKRIGNCPRFLHPFDGEVKPLVIIPDEIRKCTAFIGYRASSGMIKFGGTCFFVSKEVPHSEGRGFMYAITAKHVIDEIRDAGSDKVLIRANVRNGGAVWTETNISSWLFHPDESEAVDVAVILVNSVEGFDLRIYPLASIANQETIETEGIGVGEEIFFPGLFVHHFGSEHNIPIVRVGNIAAMPDEKVETPFGLIDAYLVEARSIGGLSGSPVFVHLGLVRHSKDGELRWSIDRSGVHYLLGLMQGHFAPFSVNLDDVSQEDFASNKERINMGIAIVVPVDRILEVLNQPAIRKLEKETEDEFRKQTLPVMESAAKEANLEEALKAAEQIRLQLAGRAHSDSTELVAETILPVRAERKETA